MTGAEGFRLGGYVLQQLINTAGLAGLYALLAVAYALLHGVTNRIVLSFGDLAAFGAFAACFLSLLLLFSGGGFGWGLALVLIGAAVFAGAISSALQSQIYLPLGRAPGQAIMIASIGASITFREIMRLKTGGREQWLPVLEAGPVIDRTLAGFSVRMTAIQGLSLLLAIVLIGALIAALRFSRAGRIWRAVSQDRRLCSLCGVNAGAVTVIAAGVAGVFSAAAGWLIAIGSGGFGFSMGLVFGLKALFACLIGGFGAIGGAILGAIVLASVETLWSAFFPIIYRDLVVFALIAAVLIFRPEGILGVPARRDSER